MLKPEVSIPVGVATVGVVYAIYQLASPPLAAVRAMDGNGPDGAHLGAAERTALWASVGIAGAISLIAKDPVPFWFGGMVAVGLSWMHRTARVVDPLTSKVPAPGGLQGSTRYMAQVAA